MGKLTGCSDAIPLRGAIQTRFENSPEYSSSSFRPPRLLVSTQHPSHRRKAKRSYLEAYRVIKAGTIWWIQRESGILFAPPVSGWELTLFLSQEPRQIVKLGNHFASMLTFEKQRKDSRLYSGDVRAENKRQDQAKSCAHLSRAVARLYDGTLSTRSKEKVVSARKPNSAGWPKG